jgi:hypothetical protein
MNQNPENCKSPVQLLLPPIGMRLRLDRSIDRARPCHDNIVYVDRGAGLHAASLRCSRCHNFRGWLRQEAFAFILNLAKSFGAPAEPLTLRDTTIGDHTMTEKKYDNSGILFRNEDKTKETDRDYQGSITIEGREFWLSGWIKQGRKGKFLGLAVKPKEESKSDKPKQQSLADEMSDQIPF